MNLKLTGSGTVHVLIATKNSDQYFEQCLMSVVEQEYLPDRVTVIDQSSTDYTREIVKSFKNVELCDQIGTGIPGAWNQGLRLGNSEFVAFLDSDDYWVPGFLAECINALRTNPDAQYALAQAKFILDGDKLPSGFRPDLVNAERIGWMPGTTVFRRGVFAQVGFFPEDFRIASDIEWYSRLRNAQVPMIQIPQIGLYKRMHGGNASLDGDIAEVYRQEILRVARNNIRSGRSITS